MRDEEYLAGFAYGTARNNQLQERRRRTAKEKLDPILPLVDLPQADPDYVRRRS